MSCTWGARPPLSAAEEAARVNCLPKNTIFSHAFFRLRKTGEQNWDSREWMCSKIEVFVEQVHAQVRIQRIKR